MLAALVTVQYLLFILKPKCSGQGVRRAVSGSFAASVASLSLSFLIQRVGTIVLVHAGVVIRLQVCKSAL